MMEMIEIEALTKVYKGPFSAPFVAVDHVGFKVKKGDIFGFLGPNGAGKTTTIRMLTTITPPTSGTAHLMGYDIVTQPNEVKRHIGYMPEKPGFYEEMHPWDLLRFYGEFYKISRADSDAKAKELLEMTGIYEFRKRKVKEFSHGMRKRVALCQALMHDPEILILDEPTGGLDPAGTHEFRELLRRLKKDGKTILLSSHLLPEVQQVCNRVGIINRGRMIDVGPIEKIERKANAQDFFLTIKGLRFTDAILEQITEIPGVKFVEPGKDHGLETLRINVEMLEQAEVERVAQQAVEALVNSGAGVVAVLPPGQDLEGAFLALIEQSQMENKQNDVQKKSLGKKHGGVGK